MSDRTRSTSAYEPWELRAHERHIYLYRHCSLCVRDAGSQRDRLMDDAQIEAMLIADIERQRVAK